MEEVLQEKARPLVLEHFAVPAATVVQTFLLPRQEIRRIWREAWSELIERVDDALNHDIDVLLTFHMSYFHQLTREYFVAADMPLLLSNLADRGARVVTLIDDIFDCHQSLIAGGSASGMMDPPSSLSKAVLDLMQVLDWRSVEIMLSESLASSLASQESALWRPHMTFAVKHPMETFFDLLFSPKRVIYFSHPISEPRRLLASGNVEGANSFVEMMGRILARLQGTCTVIEPTTIDELRFKPGSANLSPRWPFHTEARQLLYESPEEPPQSSQQYLFPAGWESDGRTESPTDSLISTLLSAIEEQIDARDHGLVEQSQIIACYRPIYDGNASRGVKEELQHYGRLVSLGMRTREASVVFSPPSDILKYPRRRLAEDMIPAWVRRGSLTGSDEAFVRLKARVLTEESEQIAELVNGSLDALMRTLAECDVTIEAGEDTILPSGALGARDVLRRQAVGAQLAEQVKTVSEGLYLQALADAGVISIVDAEQMFYDALDSQPSPAGGY